MTAYVFKRKRPPVLQYTGDYTKVGSPTITDNVVSGFSASNYLITKSVFNPLDADFEFVFKIKLDSHAINTIFAENRTGQFSKVYLSTTREKTISFRIGTGSAWRMSLLGNTTLELNTDYWIKVVKSNGTFYLYYSLDGKDYILDNSVANTSVFPSISVEGRIGCFKDSQSGNSYFHGSIDLTESYIKLNGEYWWRGAKYVNADKCYVLKRKRPTEYRKTVIDTATAGTYTFDVAKDRTAKIILVGGGGAGGAVWEGHSEGGGGGSGACVYIKAKLTAGTYTITNGAGAGSLSGNGGNSTLVKDNVTLITAGGGYGGQGGNGVPGNGGTYTISDSLDIEKEHIVSNGNTGGYGGNMVSGAGGASLYGGYGKGGNSRGIGTGGYIFVELTTDETDYDYKIDNDVCYVLKRKQYWKYEYQDWTQPVLTANGTMGGSSFACFAGSFYPDTPIYYAFDANTVTAWASNLVTSADYIGFYNPKPLLVKNIECSNYQWITGKWEVYGSNDNHLYELLTIGENTLNTNGSTFNIDLSSNTKAFRYYKIQCLTTLANSRVGMGEITITAQEQTVIKATKDDYDFITD